MTPVLWCSSVDTASQGSCDEEDDTTVVGRSQSNGLAAF